MSEQRPWHRLFALSWVDFFRGLPVTVEMEKDLSLKQQLLDLVILRKETAALPCRLPDGFEDLARFNLITFKFQVAQREVERLDLAGAAGPLRQPPQAGEPVHGRDRPAGGERVSPLRGGRPASRNSWQPPHRWR